MSGNEESEWSYDDEFLYPSSSTEYTSIPVETSKKKKKKKKNKKKNKKIHELNEDKVDVANNFGEKDSLLLSPEGEVLIDGPSSYNYEDAEEKIDLLNKQLAILDLQAEEARSEIDRFTTFHELKKRQKQLEERKKFQQQQEDQLRQKKEKPPELFSPVKVPPIYTYNMKSCEIECICNFAIGKPFYLEWLGTDKFALHCATMEQHETMKTIFEQSKKEFSLTIKENKYHRMALYGMGISMPPGELLDKLKKFESDDLKFASVKGFNSRRGQAYLVKLTYDSNLQHLKNIQIVDCMAVTWEEYYLQCSNCQQFGHRGSRCKFEPRCVKCAMKHSLDECPIKKHGFLDMCFKCALCDAAGHTADSKHCPQFKAMFMQQMQRDKEGQSLSSAQSVQELAKRDFNTTKCEEELCEILTTISDEVKSLKIMSRNMTQTMSLFRSEIMERSKNQQKN